MNILSLVLVHRPTVSKSQLIHLEKFFREAQAIGSNPGGGMDVCMSQRTTDILGMYRSLLNLKAGNKSKINESPPLNQSKGGIVCSSTVLLDNSLEKGGITEK
ncbi:hypothetical protein CEXT_404311 [Caerostris extrusa]|uniref:Uncharacterized protein n=1 Tax=Caerostris extrusa TaxID=172846 RepID=A0AAV4VAP1_CAEEX|nr:hypothetical protein CEXT_404311 [Caerostris extrusa]